MDNEKLKDDVAEAVLGVLNDARKWHDLYNMMDYAEYLPLKLDIEKSKDIKFDVPVKKMFTNNDGKTRNSFKLINPSEKEN